MQNYLYVSQQKIRWEQKTTTHFFAIHEKYNRKIFSVYCKENFRRELHDTDRPPYCCFLTFHREVRLSSKVVIGLFQVEVWCNLTHNLNQSLGIMPLAPYDNRPVVMIKY